MAYNNDDFMAELKAIVSGKYIARDRVFIHTKSGYFGVSKGTIEKDDGTDEIVAVKTSYHPCIKNSKQVVDYALIINELNHENVISLIGISYDEDIGLPLVILPYAANGGLLNYLRGEENDPTNKQLINFAMDIARGMEYIASQGIVHRFVATRCCVLDEFMSVKIGGFAFARKLDSEDKYDTMDDDQIPVKWVAPEVIDPETKVRTYNEKTDVWAYGVTLWQIMNMGATPYDDAQITNLMDYLNEGNRLPDCGASPCGMCDLTQSCWLKDQSDRPNFSAILTTLCEIADAMSN